MTFTRNSRAQGLESLLDDMVGANGLEGDLPPLEPDAGYPLRPFANLLPQDDLITTEPRSDEAPVERLYRRAVEAASRGRVSEAIHRYRELLGLDTAHLAARNNLSHLLETTGDPAEALEQLSAALRLTPDDVNLLVSRGAIHGRLKQHTEAEADLRRALKLDPGHTQGHLTLGMVLWRKGVPAQAAQALRHAISLEPDNATAHYYLGEALNQANDLPGARAALQRAADLGPDHGRTFRLLGRVLDRMGQPDEAQAMYRRAREVGET
jgi:tetratricopeptide (TPR) repeat protein